jgi:hypothetical protein
MRMMMTGIGTPSSQRRIAGMEKILPEEVMNEGSGRKSAFPIQGILKRMEIMSFRG